MPENQDWYVKAELTVIGPNEKPIILSGQYLGTNAELAKNLQNEYGALIQKLNK